MDKKLKSKLILDFLTWIFIIALFLILGSKCSAQDSITIPETGDYRFTASTLEVVSTDTSKVMILYLSPQEYAKETFVAYTPGYVVIDNYGTYFKALGEDSTEVAVPLVYSQGEPRYHAANGQPFPPSLFIMAVPKEWSSAEK